MQELFLKKNKRSKCKIVCFPFCKVVDIKDDLQQWAKFREDPGLLGYRVKGRERARDTF